MRPSPWHDDLWDLAYFLAAGMWKGTGVDERYTAIGKFVHEFADMCDVESPLYEPSSLQINEKFRHSYYYPKARSQDAEVPPRPGWLPNWILTQPLSHHGVFTIEYIDSQTQLVKNTKVQQWEVAKQWMTPEAIEILKWLAVGLRNFDSQDETKKSGVCSAGGYTAMSRFMSTLAKPFNDGSGPDVFPIYVVKRIFKQEEFYHSFEMIFKGDEQPPQRPSHYLPADILANDNFSTPAGIKPWYIDDARETISNRSNAYTPSLLPQPLPEDASHDRRGNPILEIRNRGVSYDVEDYRSIFPSPHQSAYTAISYPGGPYPAGTLPAGSWPDGTSYQAFTYPAGEILPGTVLWDNEAGAFYTFGISSVQQAASHGGQPQNPQYNHPGNQSHPSPDPNNGRK